MLGPADADIVTLQPDHERGRLIRRDRDSRPPLRALQIAKGRDDADVMRVRLELPFHTLLLLGHQLKFLACNQFGAKGFAIALENGKEIGAVECGKRLELEEPDDDWR